MNANDFTDYRCNNGHVFSVPCSECDDTGQKVTTDLDVDGVPMRVSGSAELPPEAAEALAALGRAAMSRIGGPDSPGPKGPRRKARSGVRAQTQAPLLDAAGADDQHTSRGRNDART